MAPETATRASRFSLVKPTHGSRDEEGISLDRKRRSAIGQFLTPKPVAAFMASLFEVGLPVIELLDAGAGKGSLTEAFVQRFCSDRHRPKRISVTAYELDSSLLDSLGATLSECRRVCKQAGVEFSATIHNEDFIASSVQMIRGDLFSPRPLRFNAAIVNPPYRKIRSDSLARLQLRSVGIETGNLYAGFVALITKHLLKGGELVAITPRSFCNGPYFKSFRSDFLDTMSLRQLHIFESRSAAFGHDSVLQENVIVHAFKEESQPRQVIISVSSGKPGGAITERKVVYEDVVSPGDPEQFIHLVESNKHARARSLMNRLPSRLGDLGLSVSTGRVVDFRAEPYIRQEPDKETVPLIYPCHFNGGFVHWPKRDTRKPNAIISNALTRELLVPADIYVLVKRFAAKEERRRVVACIYDPGRIHAPLVGFENHLNYFHIQGRGVPMSLAKGLAAFLNSTVVDGYFRQFSGHTQVNATDLRSLHYPTKAALEQLGGTIVDPGMPQMELDRLVEGHIF